jgi:hypothetical protein
VGHIMWATAGHCSWDMIMDNDYHHGQSGSILKYNSSNFVYLNFMLSCPYQINCTVTLDSSLMLTKVAKVLGNALGQSG